MGWNLSSSRMGAHPSKLSCIYCKHNDICPPTSSDRLCALQLATQIVGSLLALEAMDETEPIRMYINSPGGTPYSIIGVVDAMQAVKPPIQTVALGACYSYSSLLLVGNKLALHCAVWGLRKNPTEEFAATSPGLFDSTCQFMCVRNAHTHIHSSTVDS